MFVFFVFFFFFDTSVTFYASMICDSGLYMHCRLCDSFFHLFLPTLVKMGSYNPPLLLVKRVGSRPGSTFSWSWVHYFCKWYQQATLYCITFCRCRIKVASLRLNAGRGTVLCPWARHVICCLEHVAKARPYKSYLEFAEDKKIVFA